MKLILDKKPLTADVGILTVQKDKAHVFAVHKPRDYDWDIKDATKDELAYLCRCLITNKWLKKYIL